MKGCYKTNLNFQSLARAGHLRRKISASVDGGLKGGSSVRRPGSEGPHLR